MTFIIGNTSACVYTDILFFVSSCMGLMLPGPDLDPNQLFQEPNHQELNQMFHPNPRWQKMQPITQLFDFVSFRLDWTCSPFPWKSDAWVLVTGLSKQLCILRYITARLWASLLLHQMKKGFWRSGDLGPPGQFSCH